MVSGPVLCLIILAVPVAVIILINVGCIEEINIRIIGCS